MRRDYSQSLDDPSEGLPTWTQGSGTTTGESPYASTTWVYTQTSEVQSDEDDDLWEPEDDLPAWWDEIGGAVYPYAPTTWVYTQTSEVQSSEDGNLWAPGDDLPTWENEIGGTVYPYATASWVYLQDSDLILEFVTVTEFVVFDETFFDRASLGFRLDNGIFTSSPQIVYDEAEIGPEGQRGYYVSRIFAEVSVYDAKASQPGGITVATGASQQEYESGLDLDKPPGVLLGKVSYEIIGSIATIISWNHYNWEDDEPIRRAVSALINDLPDCVTEVLVADDPNAFWTSLGFVQETKGGFYLRLRR